jgi:serine/threonine protein kinase/cytochrome c-type biogenesis protein CcmH/NrfG
MTPLDINPVTASWLKVEVAVAAFEEGGRRGPDAVLEYAPPADDPHHLSILCELIRADLEFAWSAGVRRFLDDYRTHFPALFASPTHLQQVAFEEYRLRVQAGDLAAKDANPQRSAPWDSPRTGDDPSPTDPMISLPLVTPQSGLIENWAQPFPDAVVPPPEPGQHFAGFKLVSELGRGAFARVFLAEQPDLADRLVVLKVSSQLLEESQTLARFQHTNIVPIHSVHRVGQFQAVCMPFFGATTLADLLDTLRHRADRPASGEVVVSTVNQRKSTTITTSQPLPTAPIPAALSPLERFRGMTHAAAVLWLGSELADGLAHAHERGILHRDLKPANVLIADDGRPMLLDFNLAATVGRPLESAGGTPMYMAPEQLDALRNGCGTPDLRSDIYSLGLMLYELLTGHLSAVPAEWSIPERMTGLRAERAKPMPSARRLNPAISPAEGAILARCLHPNPAKRYTSARQLCDDLRAHLDHRPLVHTREPAIRERIAKFARRNPWVASTAFLGMVAAVVLVALASVLVAVMAQRDAAAQQIAARQFRDELADHKLTLVAPGSHRQTVAAIEKAKSTLTRYGLPGGEGPPDVKLTVAGPLENDLAELHLLLAAAEASRPGNGGRERASHWLAFLEQNNRPQQVARFREIWDGKEITQADDLSTLVIGRYQPRKLIAVLSALPPSALQPGHWMAKGECHSALGQFAEASACFTTALALHGRANAALLAHRGRAFLEQKEYAKALADFDAALELDPNAAEVWIDRGLTRLHSGHPRQALAEFDRALELWPEHTRTYFLRAEAKTRLSDLEGAAADRKIGLTKEPSDETSWVTRGMAKLNSRDAQGAIADFDAALKLNPRSRDARQNKAGALADHLGRVADGVTVLNELIEDAPDYLPARAGRAVYLARLRQRDAAHADAAEVLQRNPPPLLRYQVAGVFALTSISHAQDADQAVKLLAAAMHDHGGLEYVDTDPDLAPLRRDARFQAVVQAAKKLNTPLGGR